MPAPWNAHAIARIKGEIHGQETVNVLHFATNSALGGGADVALLIALAAAIMQCVETVLLPAVTQDWNVTDVETQYVGTVTGGTTTDPTVVTPTGSGVGQLAPTSVSFAAALMQLRSGVAGRRGRGRCFLPPPGEAQIANSTIDDPTLTLFVAFMNCLLGKFTGVGATTDWRLGVYSRKGASGIFSNFDANFHEVKQLTMVNKLAVISRRKAGHGR
jgi:hypothetical protein